MSRDKDISSLRRSTGGATASNRYGEAEREQIVMQDRQTANNMPVSGNRSVSDESIANHAYVSDNVVHQEPEGQPAQPRILVVEDDSTLATLEAGVLTAYGYTVSTVESGELAISMLRHSIPDLVVLDLELTGDVHGWDVLQALRASASIPVLLTTSSVTAVRKRMRDHGETKSTLDHLPKPYPMHMLLKRIQRMLTIPSY